MPTPTYIPLATVTLGTTAASVTFSSIPSSFRDLVVVTQGRSTTGTPDIIYRLNGDSSGSYSRVYMGGSSGGTFFGTDAGANGLWGFVDSTTAVSGLVQIMDYSATDKHKTILSRASFGAATVIAYAGRYAQTTAVTTVALICGSGTTFAAGSSFNLYGIAS